MESAIELLTAGGTSLESLQALAAQTSAGQNDNKQERHELECKMTIVVRADKESQITDAGLSARLVSLAVIKAYLACREFDVMSLMQWEANAWTKVALKVSS